MELIDELLEDAKGRMAKSVESTRNELATVRTGRASPHLLDRLMVDYYGAQTPIKQLAQVAATDARMLTLTPYDKSSIAAIEKAVMESDLGLTPSNDGNVIRLGIPELTEERRKELVRMVHNVAEDGRVAVRNIRRDVMHDLRELKKEGEAGSDEEHRAETELQKSTDDSIKEIDASLKGKEEENLEVEDEPRPASELLSCQRSTSRSSRTGTDAGPSSASCRWSRGTGPAPTRSRRGCATRPSWGSRS
jgi:ribosome recycling factor